MEASFITQAIVLSRKDYREHDSLVVFYTLLQGKRILLARGVKKITSKLAGHLEPFNLVDLMSIYGKNWDYVGSVIARETFPIIKKDINRLYYAGLAFNWVQKILEDEQADEDIFNLLTDYLKQLESMSIANENNKTNNLSKNQGELLFSFFIFKFLAFSGYNPQIKNCLDCGQVISPGQNFFNLNSGGLVCRHCFANINQTQKLEFLTISDNCVKLVRFILENPLKFSTKVKIDHKLSKEIFNLSHNFIKFRL